MGTTIRKAFLMLNVYACVIYKSGAFKKSKYFQKEFCGVCFFFLQSLKIKFPWNGGFSF